MVTAQSIHLQKRSQLHPDRSNQARDVSSSRMAYQDNAKLSVDVWKAEKVRMFECNITDPGQQLEVQSIIDIQAAQCEYEDQPDDPYESDDDDIFGHCHINGNDEVATNNDEVAFSPVESHAILSSLSINQETVFDFVGVSASSPPSPSFSDNKNGLLHLAYTINKDISTTFPTCKPSDCKHTVTTPQIGCRILHNSNVERNLQCSTHNGSLNYFLQNKDFTNVMQDLRTSSFSFLPNATASDTRENRENVFDFVGVSPSASSSSALNNNKNGLQTASVTSAGSAPLGQLRQQGVMTSQLAVILTSLSVNTLTALSLLIGLSI